MDAVDREELISLLSEALMRDPVFRPRRRRWVAEAERRINARLCGTGIVDHLYRSGIRCHVSRLHRRIEPDARLVSVRRAAARYPERPAIPRGTTKRAAG